MFLILWTFFIFLNALTFDAVMARQNFIFSFDIFDNWEERQPSQLSSAHKT